MNFKHILYSLVAGAAITSALASCDKDGDMIYAPAPDKAEIESFASDIVLSKTQLSSVVLTVFWNENGDITLSDPEVAAPESATTNTVQFSTTADFATTVDSEVGMGVFFKAFTTRELTNIAGRLGMAGGEKSQLFIRVKSSLADNVPASFSNVLEVSLTPFVVNMHIGYYLTTADEETGRTLGSPDADGFYRGFIGAKSWENWHFREDNYTTWGGNPVDGTAFMMANFAEADAWAMWYPAPAGCYYTTVDVNKKEWTALIVDELTVAGDIEGAMTYNLTDNKWYLTFNATPGTVNVKLSGKGSLYNASTSTDDAAAIASTVAFSGDAANLTFGEGQPETIAVQVAAAGETTLTLDLNDPLAWKLTAEAGGVEQPVEPEIPAEIFLYGINGDPWNWDWSIFLYNSDTQAYAGVADVDCAWGYQISMANGDWENIYKMADGGTAASGSLDPEGKDNIAAPEAGLNFFDVSLGALTYSVTKVDKVFFSGFNDDWALSEMTQSADDACVFTGEFTKTAETPWGAKILINDDWNIQLGAGSEPGQLRKVDGNGPGFTGDNDLEMNQTYILTVNLQNATYSFTKK